MGQGRKHQWLHRPSSAMIHTLSGTQINLSLLGKVPSAAQADSATNATNAVSAQTATKANSLPTLTWTPGRPCSP
jgi:hypothetical protein